ncbi:ATP-binding cassette domain-containing protein [Paracoccus shanxieyensis]|uniref:ATP-binding cassette domain-containing protein n=1 Tax=Paracoccus shanxieyensis TaxID=2675752 RepID=A0A6L6IVV3_9RHOB|nr:ATP-binding cassette domain-containing protein [Paracoccus shanxieyensis]MTH62724.1 ATP-binding cassette domain-containing protein [Paracoccus shanxieyensis]MTH86192.1 ATP-binding cassette domain-containing protein [Paracoccus shanxieyensis]
MDEQDGDQGAAARLLQPERQALRHAAWGSVAAGLVWLPMAFCAAQAIGGLIDGRGLRLVWVAGLLGFGLLRLGVAALAEWAGQRAASAALGRLRREVLTHVARRAVLPRAGAFASVVGEQLALIRPYAFRYGPARLRAAVVPVAVLVCAFATAWAAGLILLIAGPAIPLFMALIGHAAGKASREQLDRMSSMGALLSDRIGALPDIRLLGAQGALADSFATAAEALRRQTMRVLGIAFLSSTVLELFAALGIAMMAVFCGFSLLGQIGFGTWGAPLGTVQALFLLLIAPEFFQPLRDLAAAWHDRAAADAAAGALQREMAEAAMLPEAGAGGLALRGVRHRGIAYDLALAPGEAIAVTGPSGSGKTTLLRLLAGLEVADQGKVLRPLHPGWMPQAVHFLDDTLEANLRMGRAGDLAEALSLAAADHLVAGLPEGLATRLGERGAGLSGGEARRLTLARALYARPSVILADEPTADLDPQTAADVTRGLLAAHRAGATLVVATHDPALVAAIGREYRIGGA